MALMVERIVDGGVRAEEALGGCCRLEPLHLALSPSHNLLGVLGPIILPQPLVMTTGQMEVSERALALAAGWGAELVRAAIVRGVRRRHS
jgi:hypothetical protein